MPIYRFADTELAPSRAHRGDGQVLAARVRERLHGSSINFLDLVDVPPGTTIGAHRHAAADEELYIIVRGTATMWVDGLEAAVGPGDVIANPPAGAHALRNDGTDTLRMVVIDVSTDGSRLVEPHDLAS